MRVFVALLVIALLWVGIAELRADSPSPIQYKVLVVPDRGRPDREIQEALERQAADGWQLDEMASVPIVGGTSGTLRADTYLIFRR